MAERAEAAHDVEALMIGHRENIGFDEMEEFFLPDLAHLISLSRDEFLLWPVTGRATQITYRNIYCALCHNDTQLESWTQRIRWLSSAP